MRVIRSALYLVVFSGFIQACAPALRMERDYQLYYGEQMKYRIQGFQKEVIRFEGVVEDSRCPDGVNCVQAGRALIRLNLGDSSIVIQEGQSRLLGKHRLFMLMLYPHPNAGDTQPPVLENYMIGFRFSKE